MDSLTLKGAICLLFAEFPSAVEIRLKTIQMMLERRFGIKRHISTISRILKRLENEGFIKVQRMRFQRIEKVINGRKIIDVIAKPNRYVFSNIAMKGLKWMRDVIRRGLKDRLWAKDLLSKFVAIDDS